MALKDDINRKLKIIDTGDEIFLEEIKKTQTDLYNKILAFLQTFTTTSGVLEDDDTNNQLVIKLSKEILQIVQNSKYQDRVARFLVNFDVIEDLNKGIIAEVNAVPKGRLKVNAEKAQAIREISDQLTKPQSINANVVTPIRKIMFNAITLGTTLDAAKEELRTFIKGTPQVNGHLHRWVSQIARDSLQQWDGTINQVAAKEYELDAFRYVGSLVKDSRPQCVRWIEEKGGILRKDELQEEIDWAKKNGSGYSIYTPVTPETFAIYRGGHNCRHTAIPFRLDDDSQGRIDSAM